MRGRYLYLPAIILAACLLNSCALGPGEGGKSTITGKVFIQEYNSGGILVNEYYVADERVYLIYGDDTTYDDEFRTSYDGSYTFPYLRKGSYRLFSYSECLGCDGSNEPVFVDVTINKNGEEISAPDIVIINYI